MTFFVSLQQFCALSLVVLFGLCMAWHLGRWHERGRIATGTLDDLARLAAEERDARLARWAAMRVGR